MKAIELQDDWRLENLRLTERPDPEPGPGQVVLAMRAASLNYRDYLMVQGGYGSRGGTLPLVPCSDGVGEVVAVGPGVTRVAVGDRVCPGFFQGWLAGQPNKADFATTLGGPLDGVMTELMLLSADGVTKVPAHLTDDEAAAFPCAGLTAWSALVTHGRIAPGDVVLVQGTGGVSLFALQFAKMAGARVIATSSRDERLERLRALGADHVINYRETPDWSKRAVELTGGRGVDLVVEVGGAATLEQSIRAVRIGGEISMIGVLGGPKPGINLPLVVMREVRLQGVTVGSREGFEAMFRAVESHGMRPVIDRRFAFDELVPAFEHMAAGRHFGKIVVAIPAMA